MECDKSFATGAGPTVSADPGKVVLAWTKTNKDEVDTGAKVIGLARNLLL